MDQDNTPQRRTSPEQRRRALVTAHGLEQLREAHARLRHRARSRSPRAFVTPAPTARARTTTSVTPSSKSGWCSRRGSQRSSRVCRASSSSIPHQSAAGAAAIGTTVLLEDLTSGAGTGTESSAHTPSIRAPSPRHRLWARPSSERRRARWSRSSCRTGRTATCACWPSSRAIPADGCSALSGSRPSAAEGSKHGLQAQPLRYASAPGRWALAAVILGSSAAFLE